MKNALDNVKRGIGYILEVAQKAKEEMEKEKIYLARGKEEVERAIDFLALKFEVNEGELSTFRRPAIELGRNYAYCYFSQGNFITLPKKERYDSFGIGEEVGHWFHFQINQDLREKVSYLDEKHGGFFNEDDNYEEIIVARNRCRTLIEIVGRYSGLVYASANNEPINFSYERYQKHIEETKGFNIKKIRDPNAQILKDPFLHLVVDSEHVVGYIVSEELFKNYGDKLLGKVARLSLDNFTEGLSKYLNAEELDNRINQLYDEALKVSRENRNG